MSSAFYTQVRSSWRTEKLRRMMKCWPVSLLLYGVALMHAAHEFVIYSVLHGGGPSFLGALLRHPCSSEISFLFARFLHDDIILDHSIDTVVGVAENGIEHRQPFPLDKREAVYDDGGTTLLLRTANLSPYQYRPVLVALGGVETHLAGALHVVGKHYRHRAHARIAHRANMPTLRSLKARKKTKFSIFSW
jgi:hypothetical protein